jgi:hypothetical protein
MALTVSQSPQAYTPAYNAQTFTALSNQIAVADFKYIVTVQINGGTIFNIPILQRPDGYMTYDPISLVKNYITRDYFDPTSVTCKYAEGKSCAVEVKIKEYYTSAIQSTTTINYIAFDACLNNDDFRNLNYTDFVSNGVNVKLLSTSTTEFNNPEDRVDIKNDIWIHFFRNSTTSIVLTVYNELSVLQGTITLAIPNTNQYIYYANIGYQTLVANALTPLDGWVVEVDIKNGATTYLSTSYTFTDLCTKYEKYTIQYLKRNGNIQRFNFEMINSVNVTKKSNTVRLNPSRITAGVYGSNIWSAEKKTVSTQTTRQITLNTYWITPSQIESLEELWDSPVAWLVDSNQNYKSFTLTDNSLPIPKGFGDPLLSMKATCEYDIQETRQRGI